MPEILCSCLFLSICIRYRFYSVTLHVHSHNVYGISMIFLSRGGYIEDAKILWGDDILPDHTFFSRFNVLRVEK